MGRSGSPPSSGVELFVTSEHYVSQSCAMERILTTAGGRNRCRRLRCQGGVGGVIAPAREAMVAGERVWVHHRPTLVRVRWLSITIGPPIV